MSDNPTKPPRFPYVAALLCVACLGAAVWTWIRYSYAWDVKLNGLSDGNDYPLPGYWEGQLVRFRAFIPDEAMKFFNSRRTGTDVVAVGFWVRDRADSRKRLMVDFSINASPAFGENDVVMGRLLGTEGLPGSRLVWVDTTASRFHGASIAGLVVGAMGAFVFSVALRHWLGERRAFREEARA